MDNFIIAMGSLVLTTFLALLIPFYMLHDSIRPSKIILKEDDCGFLYAINGEKKMKTFKITIKNYGVNEKLEHTTDDHTAMQLLSYFKGVPTSDANLLSKQSKEFFIHDLQNCFEPTARLYTLVDWGYNEHKVFVFSVFKWLYDLSLHYNVDLLQSDWFVSVEDYSNV